MNGGPVTRLVLCGSPRAGGVCAQACDEAASLLAARFPQDELLRLDVASLNVSPCIGCDACRASGTCAFDDDMPRVLEALDAADELFLASPVYFAGPPAPLKSLLDRVQCRYWAYNDARARGCLPPKRPARLLVVGAGGDPCGYDPLVGCVRSALAVAGFTLEAVCAAIGCAPDTEAWVGR